MAKRSKTKKAAAAPSAKWPAAQIEMRPTKSLLAYPRNARIHSDDQVRQIVASMREFGWTIPILVDEKNVIIAGHGRLTAANKLGLDLVPVMTARGWTENQKRAYRIADNQIPLNAEWDPALLKIELTDLKIEEYPLDYTGFSNIGLVSFMSGVNDPNAWSGMPQFTPQESGWFRSITVHFKTKADVNKFAKKLGLKITDDTKTVYLPKPERKDLAAKQYAARA